MEALAALVLAAAMPVAGKPADAPPQTVGATVTLIASVEILRGETDSPNPRTDGLARHVRPLPNGQILIEFD